MMVVWIILAVIVLWAIFTYNSLIRLRAQVQNAWRQIDVQLKRRHDLIPNLVEAVKGYMKFERDTLERVVEARAKAVKASTVKEKEEAETELSKSLINFFAVVENYPDLKSNRNLLELQEELTTTENRIAFARQFYNDIVTRYNIRCQTFPSSIIANTFKFQPAELFQAGESEKGVPRVDINL